MRKTISALHGCHFVKVQFFVKFAIYVYIYTSIYVLKMYAKFEKSIGSSFPEILYVDFKRTRTTH